MELNIYFKNVGQGDTILLDWSPDQGKKKFGLIDCNLVDGGIDPLIRHIEEHRIREFEFVLLSHPHSDHFSGFPKFFDYCEANKLTIRNFLHTSYFTPEMLKAWYNTNIDKKAMTELVLGPVNSEIQRSRLLNIYTRLIREQKGGYRGFVKSVQDTNNMAIFLTNDIRLKLLSPTWQEIRSYADANFEISGDRKLKIEQDTENNPKANILSSFVQIYSENGNWQVILTSDTPKEAQRRISKDEGMMSSLQDKDVLAYQVPHHGSRHDYFPTFWRSMKLTQNTQAIISVGEGYGHPHRVVVANLDQFLPKRVHATNFVGGYREHYRLCKRPCRCELPDDFVGRMPGVSGKNRFLNTPGCAIDPPCCEKRLQISINDICVTCTLTSVPEQV